MVVLHRFYCFPHLTSGKGIGGAVTGKLFDPTMGLGERWTFRFYSVLSLLVLIVYSFITCVSKLQNKPNKDIGELTAKDLGKFIRIPGLKILGRVGTHIFYLFFSGNKYNFMHFEWYFAFQNA